MEEIRPCVSVCLCGWMWSGGERGAGAEKFFQTVLQQGWAAGWAPWGGRVKGWGQWGKAEGWDGEEHPCTTPWHLHLAEGGQSHSQGAECPKVWDHAMRSTETGSWEHRIREQIELERISKIISSSCFTPLPWAGTLDQAAQSSIRAVILKPDMYKDAVFKFCPSSGKEMVGKQSNKIDMEFAVFQATMRHSKHFSSSAQATFPVQNSSCFCRTFHLRLCSFDQYLSSFLNAEGNWGTNHKPCPVVIYIFFFFSLLYDGRCSRMRWWGPCYCSLERVTQDKAVRLLWGKILCLEKVDKRAIGSEYLDFSVTRDMKG